MTQTDGSPLFLRTSGSCAMRREAVTATNLEDQAVEGLVTAMSGRHDEELTCSFVARLWEDIPRFGRMWLDEA